MDVAQLGFQIDSRQAVAAQKNLDGMAQASDRAAKAADQVASSGGRARDALGRFVKGAGQAKTATSEMERELKRIQGTMNEAKKLLVGFFSVAALISAARNLQQIADGYANIQGRLRLVTQSQEQLGNVTAEVFSISQRTYASMDATATLVARTTRALVSSGTAQDVALEKSLLLSEAINNAFLVSGASTAEASNAIIQLSQGLAAGALRGEEFNSIAEQGPRIMQALAQYLGVTTGELRAMAQEGKLTAEVVQNALLASFNQLSEEAAQMPVTIGRALQQLDNSFTMLVGQLDQASQGSAGVAGAIQTIAQAIDMVTPSLLFLVQAWANNKGATDDSANATRQLAEAMRTVVGGLIIAKNAVDVLVDGFRVMVQVGIAAAVELVEGFDDVATTFGALITGLQNPGSLLGSVAEIDAAMGRLGERAQRVLQVGEEAGRGFQESLSANIADVALVFEMLNQELQGTPASAAPAVAAVEGLGLQAGMSAEEVNKLAAAQKAMLDLIGGLRGSESPEIQVQEDYAKTLRDIEQVQRKLIAAGEDEATVQRMVAEATKLATAQRDREILAIARQAQQKERQRNATGALLAAMDTELSLLSMSEQARSRAAAALDAEQAMRRAIEQAQEAGAVLNDEEIKQLLELARLKGEAIDQGRELEAVLSSAAETPFSRLVKDLDMVKQALADATDPAQVQRLQSALGSLRQQGLESMVGATQEVLRSIQGFAEKGSNAYRNMEAAQHALNLVMAIGGIVNQANGDPYTAWARMAAMAATMASYVGSNFGGTTGFVDTAAQRQATQGTGTVLGDAEAKSESIQNALDITADATTQLVGINRGMLQALQQLQGGLDRAGGMLARGAGQAPFSMVGGSFSFGDAFLGGALSALPLDPLNILGGTQSVTDQGIAIMAGAIEDITLGAFQEVQYRRWRFGSRRTREEILPVGQELENQFQLVVDSIVDTVRAAADALGLLPAEVEAAIAEFRLEEIRISLKDLSAEEQQAELLAVFSAIFDGIAGDVVPFVEQFQRVGEGLGETLVRVATGVQVTREAMDRLGFSLGDLGPEAFAIVSEGLIEMAGGLDAFIEGMGTFMDRFAPEAHRFQVLQDDLTDAFGEAGLVLPTTRDGMWQLMQTLDATTESGQAQIATLLRLAGVADAYYTMIERREEDRLAQFDASAAMDYANMVGDLNRQLRELSGASEFQMSLENIALQYNNNVRRLNELAQAAGLAAAREEDLATALQVSTMQRMRAIAALEAEGRALVESLGFGPLGLIDQQIAALEEQESRASVAVQSFGDAMTEAAQTASDAIDLLLGDLSPLRDQQKLDLALQGLRQGRVSQEQVLEIGRRLFGSGGDYRALFQQVLAIGANQLGGNTAELRAGAGPSGAPGISPEMQALLTQREAIEAEQRASQRFMEASELAQIIADLSGARGEDFETVARSLGLTGLDQLLTDLRLTDNTALQDYLTALQADSYSLEDLAATVTAGEQLIVDTLRQAFELENATEARRDNLEGKSLEKQGEVKDELASLRDQMAELIARVEQVASNTGRAADAAESQADTVADQALTSNAGATRSTRIRSGVGPSIAKTVT